jgi:predicted CopG family antitoxin
MKKNEVVEYPHEEIKFVKFGTSGRIGVGDLIRELIMHRELIDVMSSEAWKDKEEEIVDKLNYMLNYDRDYLEYHVAWNKRFRK